MSFEKGGRAAIRETKKKKEGIESLPAQSRDRTNGVSVFGYLAVAYEDDGR